MNILIRNLDNSTKVKLEAGAKAKKMSLNAYCVDILTDYATRPEVRSMNDKYSNLVSDVAKLFQEELASTKETLATNTEVMAETNELLAEIKKMIKRG